MQKKYILPLVLVFATILIVSNTSVVSADCISETNSPTLHVIIESAFYCDLEMDGIENDIFSTIHISFTSSYYYNHLYLYLDLELPSGRYFAYLISLQFYGLYEYTLEASMLNHALESGDYILYTALFFNLPHDPRFAYSEMIFDPPGSDDGCGDPPPLLVIE